MGFSSLAEIAERAKAEQLPFWRVIFEDDCVFSQTEPESSWKKMQDMYQAMKAADEGYDENQKSASGLVGGDGARMAAYAEAEKSLCGSFFGQVIARALKMGESNACMRRIVAAPTAGSCGVLPAVLLTYEKERQPEEERILQALYVAAGIGGVIAVRSSISGARGGCQAEIGASSAMAAGALTFLQGGDTEAILHSAAMALKNLLGLVCDPVAGLVEVPCVKRNVIGAVNALSAADMALAGVRSAIPPDEVIDAMRSVGDLMSGDLRETGRGGLAGTPTGRAIFERLKKR
ncbi:L-serine ammonia-lyase, iron-sulfur-dependent, subunit alpha [Hominifimenecus sp. rT4P-3]|uniref:L-serine ammonia-lyase, iron-sulfur-dependent, subunit alpha n=1 Tax=Hominifimenecus sp. rT4P-3 TaxID=3242979 RepID=UPI003DA563EF